MCQVIEEEPHTEVPATGEELFEPLELYLTTLGEQPMLQPDMYVIKAWEQEGPNGCTVTFDDVGTVKLKEGEDFTVEWKIEASASQANCSYFQSSRTARHRPKNWN